MKFDEDESVVKTLDFLNINHSHLATAEERADLLKENTMKRSFINWIDHSAITNRGFLLGTIQNVYDKRFFLTDEEMLTKCGINIDVQSIVEEPQVILYQSA